MFCFFCFIPCVSSHSSSLILSSLETKSQFCHNPRKEQNPFLSTQCSCQDIVPIYLSTTSCCLCFIPPVLTQVPGYLWVSEKRKKCYLLSKPNGLRGHVKINMLEEGKKKTMKRPLCPKCKMRIIQTGETLGFLHKSYVVPRVCNSHLF